MRALAPAHRRPTHGARGRSMQLPCGSIAARARSRPHGTTTEACCEPQPWPSSPMPTGCGHNAILAVARLPGTLPVGAKHPAVVTLAVRSMRAQVTPASSSATSFSTVWHAGPTVITTKAEQRRERVWGGNERATCAAQALAGERQAILAGGSVCAIRWHACKLQGEGGASVQGCVEGWAAARAIHGHTAAAAWEIKPRDALACA